MRRKNASVLMSFFLLFLFAFVIIRHPAEVSASVKDALFLCADSVIPSLFPFFVISNLLISLDIGAFCEKYLRKITRPLFGISASLSPALALGLIGGYPMGAITCAEAYSQKLCTKEDAERALAFCNNCGPAFILGAIGSGVFSSGKAGTALLIIHISAALTTGILFHVFRPPQKSGAAFAQGSKCNTPGFAKAFTSSVAKALSSSLSISAYVVLFSALVKMMTILGIFPFIGWLFEKLLGCKGEIASAFASGFFEMTVGSFSIARYASSSTAFILISFLLGWGGLSVHAQALSFISDTDLSVKNYFCGKIMHGTISAFFAYIYTRFSDISAVSVFADYSGTYCEVVPRGVILIILCFFYFFCKKGWKKI